MSKELIEKKNDLINKAEEVLNKAKLEKRELTEAEAAELAEIRDNVRRIIDHLKLEDDFKDLSALAKKKDATPVEDVNMTAEEKARAKEVQECRAFENYVRGRVIHERAGELDKGENGAIIPTTIVNYIIRKVYNICPILERSQKYNVKGKLDLPYYPANSNKITVAYKEEFVPLTSSASKFSTVELTGFLAGCLTKISRSLINNVDFNITNFIVDEMAIAIKRFIENELLNGTVGKVTGLSTLNNKITAQAADAITADEVIRLHDAIKDDFQQDAIWIMSSETRTALRMLKSSTGYYLLNDDVSTPFGTSLLGKPVYVSDNMPEIGAGNTAIYYGDMKGLATKFNEEITIEVLREKYADEHAVGVIGWFEFDGKVVNEQKIAKLVMAE